MVVLATDNGVYYELPIPGKITIGRGSNNNIQPDSQSISKNHAAIIIYNKTSNEGGGIEAQVEDYESRNGTFAGYTPMEVEKIHGKKTLRFGDYIRFGNYAKFYRYLEYPPPVDETSRRADEGPIQAVPLKGVVESIPLSSSLVAIPTFTQPQVKPSQQYVDGNQPVSSRNTQQPTLTIPNSRQNTHNSYSEPDNRNIPPYQHPSLQDRQQSTARQSYASYNNNDEPKNMTISINYPTASSHQPIAIHIDNAGRSANHNSNHNNTGNNRYDSNNNSNIVNSNVTSVEQQRRFDPLLEASENYHSSNNIDDGDNEIEIIPTALNDIKDRDNHRYGNSNFSQNRGNNRIATSNEWNISDNNFISPTAIEGEIRPIEVGMVRNKNSKAAWNNSLSADSTTLAYLLRNTQMPGNMNASIGLNNKPKVRVPPVRAKLVELVELPSSSQVDWIINQIVSSAAKINGTKTDLSKIEMPSYVQAEILAEDMQFKDEPIINRISAVIHELNSLLKQSFAGMNLDSHLASSIAVVSLNFDSALDDFTLNVLNSTLASLNRIHEHNLIAALAIADTDGYPNDVSDVVATTAIRLSRLYTFLSNQYLQDEYKPLSQKERYEVQTFVLSKNLQELDATVMELWGILQAHDNAGNKQEQVNQSINRSVLDSEIDDLRKLKSSLDVVGTKANAFTVEEKNTKIRKLYDNLRSCLLYYKLKRWKEFHKIQNNLLHRRKTLKRFVMTMQRPVNRCVSRLFHRWNKAIANESNNMVKEEEMCRLRNDLHATSARLFEVENTSDLVASLMAERAMNRELSSLNRELRLGVQELENKLLDCACGPVAMRKCLVREVLFSREDMLAATRREANSLKEEFTRLQKFVSVPLHDLTNNLQLTNIDATSKKGEAGMLHTANRTKGSNKGKEMSPERGNFSPKKTQQQQLQQQQLNHPSKRGLQPPQLDEDVGMTRSIASQVVMYEVRRMRLALQNLRSDKDALQNRLIDETCRNTQLNSSLQVLQHRLTDRERSQSALLLLLKQRIGEKGVAALIDSLEELGAGCHALLKDVVPLYTGSSPPTDDVDNFAGGNDHDYHDGGNIDDYGETTRSGNNNRDASNENGDNYRAKVEAGIF